MTDEPSKTLKEKLRELPDKPGCYLMRNREGRIIYVGKAASLRKRVQSYFRAASLRRGDPKLRSLVHSVADIEIIELHNEAAAVLTEARLIKQYRPRYNVTLRDDKRFLLLRVGLREPVPRFTLVRIRRDDGARYFGPYASSAAARAALDFVERRFGLRKCAPRVPDAETYRHCHNDIIRQCSAPCIGRISLNDYRERVETACEFLRGRRPAYLKALREEMQEAAANRHYEQAAALRDLLDLLQRALRQHARMASTPQMQREAAEHGLRELQDALGLSEPPRVIEAFDVSNISGTHAVASMVCAIDGIPQANRYRRFRIKTVTGSDDPAMMGEAVARRFRRLREQDRPPPDLLLIDGGITQLRAARAALAEHGFDGVPSAGLAKRFEELHLDRGDAPPLRLPRDSAALTILRRLRDEAHRFAVDYHRRLRERQIRNSVLDDVPGVGAKRKQMILERFGSVRAVLKAGPDRLCDVPGVGPRLAADIWKALRELTP